MKRFYTNAVVKFLAFCLTALFSVGAEIIPSEPDTDNAGAGIV